MSTNNDTDDDLAQQLRDAIDAFRERGWSVNAIAKAAGVSQSNLNRWLIGAKADLSLTTASRLCSFLGCRLTKCRVRLPH